MEVEEAAATTGRSAIARLEEFMVAVPIAVSNSVLAVECLVVQLAPIIPGFRTS